MKKYIQLDDGLDKIEDEEKDANHIFDNSPEISYHC